uniref:Aldehyde dehydrogenase n=1 Tax=Hucho hucho TaxID=62062 RepID=A0A4W5ME43_9TELE
MEMQVVQRARETFLTGRSRPLEFRVQQLKSLQRMITDRQGEIATALKQDINRSQYDTPLLELIGLENEISLAVSKLAQWAAPRPVEKSLLTISDQVYIQPEPLGVVLIIGAWNYPWALTLQPLVGAIAAGTPPCSFFPLFLFFHSCVIFSVTLDCKLRGTGTGRTGSTTRTGDLMRIADTPLPGCSLILASPMRGAGMSCTGLIETETFSRYLFYLCDFGLCVHRRRITWGKFVNCGQTCIAPDYILCESSIQNRVVEGIRQTLLEFYGPDPKSSPDYGRIINQRHFNRVMALLDGYTAALGGQSDASQRYIAPTVVKDVPPHARLMQEEIFGPLLPIVTVSDVDDAIHFISEREKPLALYVFSSNKKVIKRMLAETTSGGVTVNDVMMHYTLNSLPFGGVGQSGTGRYHGKHTFDQFSHHRACLVKSLGMEGVNMPRYPPQNHQKARKVRMAMRTPLVDFSKGTYIWAVTASIVALGLLVALIVILILAAGVSCTCW